MPDYIFLPYQCKRYALDYAESLSAIKDMEHVAYLGDSVLRSSFCGHLYSQLHNNTVGEDCTFSNGWPEYQKSDKSWVFGIDDARDSIRFTQRFIDDHPERAVPNIQNLLDYGTDVTHILTNLGMWFGPHKEEQYIKAVLNHLEAVYSIFGSGPRYTWVNTYSVSAPVICHGGMRRGDLEHHGEWAIAAINSLKARHPDIRMNMIYAHPMVDSRPDSTSDGR